MKYRYYIMMNTVKLLVDNRECKFREVLEQKSVDLKEVETLNLENGDFVITIDNQPIVIIERKTLSDLASSIKDKRYANQKMCLLSKYDRKHIYYVIEGNFGGYCKTESQQYFSGIERKNIIGSILNTMIRDDIKVINTKSLEETYDLVFNIFERISKDPRKYISEQKEHESTQSMLLVNKNKSNTIFFNILCQIPGISSKVASTITTKYDTLSKFYDAFVNLDDGEKLKVLKELKLESSTGASRAVSKTTLNSIITHLFH
jgi:ERCC4-type nuclease